MYATTALRSCVAGFAARYLKELSVLDCLLINIRGNSSDFENVKKHYTRIKKNVNQHLTLIILRSLLIELCGTIRRHLIVSL